MLSEFNSHDVTLMKMQVYGWRNWALDVIGGLERECMRDVSVMGQNNRRTIASKGDGIRRRSEVSAGRVCNDSSDLGGGGGREGGNADKMKCENIDEWNSFRSVSAEFDILPSSSSSSCQAVLLPPSSASQFLSGRGL